MSKTCVIHQETTTETTVNKDQFKMGSPKIWPINSAAQPAKLMKNRLSSFQPNMLLRSGSLDRIRQFPSYLCRRGSGGQLVTWIYNSRTIFTQALSFTHEQLRSLMFIVSVYLMVGLVVAQLAASVIVLSIVSSSLPTGLIFLLACIAITSVIGFKTIPQDTKREKKQ